MGELKNRLLHNVKDYKRLICIALCVVMALLLIGCNKTKNETKESDGRMSLIFGGAYARVYRDNNTGVQYLSVYESGTCVLVNADGTPYTGG